MTDKVEARRVRVYEDKAGEYRWTARDSNGEAVADSNEGYKTRWSAYEAARDLFPDAVIEAE
jgi:uncharacterized protein YegP (UPF0339 family)